MLLRKRVDIGVLQYVKTFGVGLHQSVFDAVVHHLDEVTRAHGTCVNIALLDPRIAALAPAGARNIADPGRQRGKDRIEPVDHGLVAADHHAITALDAPDAAAGADVDIVDALFVERLAAADVVLPERVAAVDDDVSLLKQL